METTGTMDMTEAEDFSTISGKTNVLELIDKAKNLLESSRKLPLINRIIVDQEVLLNLLEEIRQALPSNVKQASQVLHRREHIINQALVEARRIAIANAEDIEAKTQEHSLVTQAEKKAQEILKQAENQVKLMMVDAEKQITAPRESSTYLLSRNIEKFYFIFSHLWKRIIKRK